jgi:hypothetical protein
MDMVFNYLPDALYTSVRNHNYGNPWFSETTNEGEFKYNSQITWAVGGGFMVGVWCRY